MSASTSKQHPIEEIEEFEEVPDKGKQKKDPEDEHDDEDEDDEDFDPEGEVIDFEDYNEDITAIASALVSEEGDSIADIMADIREQLRNLVKIGKVMVKRA